MATLGLPDEGFRAALGLDALVDKLGDDIHAWIRVLRYINTFTGPSYNAWVKVSHTANPE